MRGRPAKQPRCIPQRRTKGQDQRTVRLPPGGGGGKACLGRCMFSRFDGALGRIHHSDQLWQPRVWGNYNRKRLRGGHMGEPQRKDGCHVAQLAVGPPRKGKVGIGVCQLILASPLVTFRAAVCRWVGTQDVNALDLWNMDLTEMGLLHRPRWVSCHPLLLHIGK